MPFLNPAALWDFLFNQIIIKRSSWLALTLVPDSVAPLWVLPGVVASGSSCGSSPMEKEALLGSPRPEVSSPSLSAEMANFGSKLGREPWFRLSVSVEWDSEGLDQRGRFSWDEWTIKEPNVHVKTLPHFNFEAKLSYISAKSGVQLRESTVSGLSLFFSSISPFSSRCPRDKSRLL